MAQIRCKRCHIFTDLWIGEHCITCYIANKEVRELEETRREQLYELMPLEDLKLEIDRFTDHLITKKREWSDFSEDQLKNLSPIVEGMTLGLERILSFLKEIYERKLAME